MKCVFSVGTEHRAWGCTSRFLTTHQTRRLMTRRSFLGGTDSIKIGFRSNCNDNTTIEEVKDEQDE